MARQRRGGFKPTELRGTLGTLLRTTLAQAGVVRDAIERGAREGRSRLDDVRTHRRRSDALAELGEIVLELVRDGEIDLAELPEARDVIARLDELDARDPDAPDRAPRAPTRKRFDDRDDGTVSSGARPAVVAPARPRALADEREPPPAKKRAAPARRGGISFDDDSDLADYMHPDDVPPKPGSDSDA